MNIKKYKDILGKNLYIQGFAANPIFLNLTGYSGFIKEYRTKLRISHFIVKYKNGYAEAGYYIPDFSRIWKIIKPKILYDFNYLIKFKKEYLKDWQKYLDFYKIINKIDLSSISNKKLIDILKRCAKGQIYSAGISHVFIEPIGMEIEKELREDLLQIVDDGTEFNNVFNQLSASTEYSWVIKEEMDLKKISKLSKSRIKLELKKHLKKYFYIQNSYKESKNITIEDLQKRLIEIKNEKLKIEKLGEIKRRKKKIIKELRLGGIIRKKLRIVDFISIWQDERKANIFIAIHYLDNIIREISRRINIEQETLYYLSPKEVMNIKNIDEIESIKSRLLERKKGCYYYIHGINEEKILRGSDYEKINNLRKKINKKENRNSKSLHGSIANTGTAIGRVVICKNISHITKVQMGDILVSSMTRPEFMPAIKKAGAIVTDEGGITCHAAIVARELGKPCVIGTKVATKALKEGMVVEVRANHGIVNVVKAATQKTLYLWDLAGTLFYEKWNSEKTEFNSFNDWVEFKTKKRLSELSDRKYESMYNLPYRKGWYFNLDLNKGFKKVLGWTKYNEVFTAGTLEQIINRSKYLNPKVGYNILEYYQKINSTFDFGETNDKTEEMFLSILDNKYKEGFRTVVYTDDKVENAKFFKQVAEKIKEKYNDFDYRVYHILNDDKGLRNKDWYCEIGSLYDLLENEKSINK